MSLMTTRADIEGTGAIEIPALFDHDYRYLSAALDFARIYGSKNLYRHAARELDTAADHAENIALIARRKAREARAKVLGNVARP